MIAFVILIVVLILAVVGVVWYVKPTQELTLDFKPFVIQDKIKEVVQSRKMEVRLTEQEINDLLKQQLQNYKQLPHDLRLTGANFDLQGQQLVMDANVIWKDQIPTTLTLTFDVNWQNGSIVIQHTGTKLKQWDISKSWLSLQPITIPIADHLPQVIAVKDVIFEEDEIVFKLKLAL